MLSGPSFNTDMIQGFVERAGHHGTYIDVYRAIAYRYSLVDPKEIVKYKKRKAAKCDSLFRAVMKLNTARSLVVDPCLCIGGELGYVDSLFAAFNVKFD